MCKGPEIGEGSVKKELMYIKMVLNFNNYMSDKPKTFPESLLKPGTVLRACV